MNTFSTIERAFQLVRSGSVPTMQELERQPRAERLEAVAQHMRSPGFEGSCLRFCVNSSSKPLIRSIR